MPLHDLTYRRFGGERIPRLGRIWALGRTGLELLLRKRSFLLLLALGWAPAVVRGAQIYIVRQIPQASDWMEVGPGLWKSFLVQQIAPGWFAVLLALYAGSGAIASDLRAGALVLYFSKPLSRLDYLIARAIPPLLSILAITLAPALLLLGFELSLAENLSLLEESPWLPLSIAGYSLWVALYFSVTILAVSSLSPSRLLAAAGYVMVAAGSHAAYGVLSRMTYGDAPPYVSLVASALHAADGFFGLESAYEGSPLGSIFGMALVMAGSVFLIDRRLRSTEVVS